MGITVRVTLSSVVALEIGLNDESKRFSGSYKQRDVASPLSQNIERN